MRQRNGISFTIETSALEPGHAYTVWWVIFNRPRYCADPLLGGLDCGISDLDAPEFDLNGDLALCVSTRRYERELGDQAAQADRRVLGGRRRRADAAGVRGGVERFEKASA